MDALPPPLASHDCPESAHETFMKLALAEAERALDEGEVPVGCVFVLDDKILGTGRNQTVVSYNATQHAEMVAIATILKTHSAADIAKSRLYVTVEPCIMCASALAQLGVCEIVFGCGNDKFGGCGSVLDVLTGTDARAHVTAGAAAPIPTPHVVQGVFRKEAIMLLRRFYLTTNSRAPEPQDKTKRILKPVD